MEYKAISSMAHAWSDSFMSDMDSVEDGLVFKDLHEIASAQRGAKVVINWIPATSEDLFKFPPRVRKRVMAYRQRLDEHLKRHRIDAAALVAFRTELYVAENSRMYVRSYVLDDRNKEHVAFSHS